MHGRESKAGVQLGFKCMAGKAWRQVHGRESMTDAHLAAEKQYLGRLYELISAHPVEAGFIDILLPASAHAIVNVNRKGSLTTKKVHLPGFLDSLRQEFQGTCSPFLAIKGPILASYPLMKEKLPIDWACGRPQNSKKKLLFARKVLHQSSNDIQLAKRVWACP
eukprot:114714-Pelagomonas_calceolata.AAC.1